MTSGQPEPSDLPVLDPESGRCPDSATNQTESAARAVWPCDALPPAVRSRMVALASRGISKMPAAQVPAALRPSAAFAPARRSKLLGPQIAAAVELDADFREHLAIQVRALPEVGAALESTAPGEGSRTESAAVAFILRTEGWAEVVESAVAAAAADHDASRPDHADTVERLSSALARARGDTKQARARYRAQLDELKSDNAQLRQTLGQTRVELRDAQRRADDAATGAETTARAAATSTRAHEADVRRLQARVIELESQNSSARRAIRGDRDAEVVRLRLLIDTMGEAVAGLRRELALPPSNLLPADTVDAIEPGTESLVSGVGRALLDDDPLLLRRLIELPKVHLIVDGYNVSKTAWPSDPLDRQRERLVTGVSALVAGRGVETTVVFDGAELLHPPMVATRRVVRIRFSPHGVIADDIIRALVEAEPAGRPVVVVTTDRELATSVTKKGARTVASLALVRAMGR